MWSCDTFSGGILVFITSNYYNNGRALLLQLKLNRVSAKKKLEISHVQNAGDFANWHQPCYEEYRSGSFFAVRLQRSTSAGGSPQFKSQKCPWIPSPAWRNCWPTSTTFIISSNSDSTPCTGKWFRCGILKGSVTMLGGSVRGTPVHRDTGKTWKMLD